MRRTSMEEAEAHEALERRMRSSQVRVEVFCQVEWHRVPGCKQCTLAYVGEIDNFDPDHVNDELTREGWVYRRNDELHDHQQWVCPVCLDQESC